MTGAPSPDTCPAQTLPSGAAPAPAGPKCGLGFGGRFGSRFGSRFGAGAALLAGLLSLPVPAMAQTPAARDPASLRAPYGVLAYSREADRWGRSWGYAFSNLAISRAVRECGRPDCEAVLLLSGDCGAIASGPSSYGFGRGPTVTAALATAMRMCASQRARGCRPLVTVCAAGPDRP